MMSWIPNALGFGSSEPKTTAGAGMFNQAVSGAQAQYPLLQKMPIELTQGAGPYHSETYFPWSGDNPMPGKLDIQIRDKDPKTAQQLKDTVVTESIHMLGTTTPNGQPYDPHWYGLKQQLKEALGPEDQKLSQEAWKSEQGEGEKRSYDQMMQSSWLDMLIRGYLFPESQGQEWVDRKGRWPENQQKILDQMGNYLKAKSSMRPGQAIFAPPPGGTQ